MIDDLYKQDVWLWDLDWTPTELKVKKAKPPKVSIKANSVLETWIKHLR